LRSRLRFLHLLMGLGLHTPLDDKVCLNARPRKGREPLFKFRIHKPIHVCSTDF
jgi:hypothetical protein